MPLFNTVPCGVKSKATYNTSTTTENPCYTTTAAVQTDDIACCSIGALNPPFLVSANGDIAGFNIQNNLLNKNIDLPVMTRGQIVCHYDYSKYYYISQGKIIVFSIDGTAYSITTSQLPAGSLYWITVTPITNTVTIQTLSGIYQYNGELTTTISSSDWTLINDSFVEKKPKWIKDGVISNTNGDAYIYFGNGEITFLDKLNNSGITWTKAIYDFTNVRYYFLSSSYIYTWNMLNDKWETINFPSGGGSSLGFDDLCFDHSLNSLFGIKKYGIWIFNVPSGVWSKIDSDLSGNLICSDSAGNFLIGDIPTSGGVITTNFTYFTYPLSTTTTTKTLVPALEKIKTITLPEGHMYGDYDRDCAITDVDIDVIYKMLLKSVDFEGWADFNNDQRISSFDWDFANLIKTRQDSNDNYYYFCDDYLSKWNININAEQFKIDNGTGMPHSYKLSKTSKYLWYYDIEINGLTENSVITVDNAISVDFSNHDYSVDGLIDMQQALCISKGLSVDLSNERVALLDVVQDGEINDKDIDLLSQYNAEVKTLDPTTMLTKAMIHSDYTIDWFDIIPMENKIRIIVKKLPSHPIPLKITCSDISGNSYKYKGSILYISNNSNILDCSATVDDILGGE